MKHLRILLLLQYLQAFQHSASVWISLRKGLRLPFVSLDLWALYFSGMSFTQIRGMSFRHGKFNKLYKFSIGSQHWMASLPIMNVPLLVLQGLSCMECLNINYCFSDWSVAVWRLSEPDVREEQKMTSFASLVLTTCVRNVVRLKIWWATGDCFRLSTDRVLEDSNSKHH